MASLREVMAKDPMTVGSDVTVAQAAAAMVRGRVGSLLVQDGDVVVGIFTERDVLRAAGADGDLLATKVRDWMTREPTTAPPDEGVEQALATMLHGGFRHLPVEEGGTVIGIVSLRDVLGDRFESPTRSSGPASNDSAPESSPAPVRERREEMFDATRRLQAASRSSVTEVAAWRQELAAALDVVEDVVTRHIAATEGPDGLHEELVRITSGRLSASVRRLCSDHERSRELVAELGRALETLAEPGELRQMADELFAQLEAHRHRGSDLLWQAYGVEIGVGD